MFVVDWLLSVASNIIGVVNDGVTDHGLVLMENDKIELIDTIAIQLDRFEFYYIVIFNRF